MKRNADRKVRNAVHRLYKARGRDLRAGKPTAFDSPEYLRIFRRSLGF